MKNLNIDYEFRIIVNKNFYIVEDILNIVRFLKDSRFYVIKFYKYIFEVLDEKISGNKDLEMEYL